MDPVTQLIRILTYAGVFPFVLMDLFTAYMPGPWSLWMIQYGAVIISFIAGMQWGICLELERSIWVLILSIACALGGWLSLLTTWTALTIGIQILLLWLLYGIDYWLVPEDAYPMQYLITRQRATMGVILLLLIQLGYQLS